MLRVAVPNKGSSCPSRHPRMLREAGYRQRSHARELVLQDPLKRHRVLLPPPARHRHVRRIRTARRRRNRSGPAARQRRRRQRNHDAGVRRLDFSVCRPSGTASGENDFDGLRIATSYPALVART